MNETYDECVIRFQHVQLLELIAHGVEHMADASLLERFVTRERFLRIAFYDLNVLNQDRSIAACWARSIESIIVLIIQGDKEKLTVYNEVRMKALQDATSLGYGTVTHRIRQETDASMQELLLPDPNDPLIQAQRDRGHFLGCIAFGRAEDD